MVHCVKLAVASNSMVVELENDKNDSANQKCLLFTAHSFVRLLVIATVPDTLAHRQKPLLFLLDTTLNDIVYICKIIKNKNTIGINENGQRVKIIKHNIT